MILSLLDELELDGDNRRDWFLGAYDYWIRKVIDSLKDPNVGVELEVLHTIVMDLASRGTKDVNVVSDMITSWLRFQR